MYSNAVNRKLGTMTLYSNKCDGFNYRSIVSHALAASGIAYVCHTGKTRMNDMIISLKS